MSNKRKFDLFVEGTFQRFQGGNFLAGDVITFKKNALSSDWVKGQATQLVDKIKDFMDTDLNLRVTAVKALRPAASGDAQQDNQVDEFYLDIVREIGPGQFHDFMTIPAILVDVLDTGINEPPIPDSIRRQDTSHINPEEVETGKLGEESPTNGTWQTRRHAKAEDLENPKKNKKMKSIKAPVDNFTTKVYAEAMEGQDIGLGRSKKKSTKKTINESSSKKLIKKEQLDDVVTIKLYFDREWDEHTVAWFENGKYDEDKTYFGDSDRGDAIDSFDEIKQQYLRNKHKPHSEQAPVEAPVEESTSANPYLSQMQADESVLAKVAVKQEKFAKEASAEGGEMMGAIASVNSNKVIPPNHV